LVIGAWSLIRHSGFLIPHSAWVVVIAIMLPSFAFGNEDPVTVERAVFQQEKALAHMKELEERMFRLAELIRESQPEDSARLLLGVRKSRDELLGERMRQAASLVGSLDLRDATDEQKQIIHELESLRTLLLTADLDTELKLEQLKLMREAIEKIDKLIEAETNQLNQTEPLAGAEAPAKPLLDALRGDEQRNAKTAEGIKELVSKLDGGAGKQAPRVGAAGNDMNAAAGQLGQGEPGQAAGNQKEAINKLRDARNRIDEARQKLQKELEMTVRKQVMENLEDMLTRQTQVREATEALSDKAAEQQPQALLAVRRLAEAEDGIHALCVKTIELATETGFSITLPPTLEAIGDQIIIVSDDLRIALADRGVIDRQKRIEEHLTNLIDAMEQSNANADPNDNPNNQPPGVNQKRQEMNKLLAEVRMLRILQLAVNDSTTLLENDRVNKDLSAGRVRRLTQKLADRQDDVRATTVTLDQKIKQMQQQGGMP